MAKQYSQTKEVIEEPQKKTSFNDIVSLDEASKMLGVSRQTMYLYNHKRLIPYLHALHGKKVYYYKEDLLKFISGIYEPTMDEIKNNVNRKGGSL